MRTWRGRIVCCVLMWELTKGKLRSLVRQQQHLNRPGTPAGAGTGDHSKPWSLAGNEKIRETAEPALPVARGQRRYVRILEYLRYLPQGARYTVLGRKRASAAAPPEAQRRGSSSGPGLAHRGRGNEQVTSQVPSRTSRQVTALKDAGKSHEAMRIRRRIT
ncbi:hypothetical protein V8C34DRAFT_173768 [Trichoderma compactum]